LHRQHNLDDLFSHYNALVTFGDTKMKDHKNYLLQDPDERDIYERTETSQGPSAGIVFSHVTEKQLNYIEILKNDLGMSTHTRNAHITSIVGKRWLCKEHAFQQFPDVWALSRSEASQVIEKFRQWKEEKK
jgi:hypothetical protein